MFCCSQPIPASATAAEVSQNQAYYSRKARDYRIAAFALAIITVVAIAAACALFGTGTLPPLATRGLGIFPYLGGIFITTLGTGLLVGSISTASIAAFLHYKNDKWQRFTPLSSPAGL